MLRIGHNLLRQTNRVKNCDYKRYLATAVQPKTKENAENKVERKPAAAVKNYSFISNIFKGELEATEVFPYPEALNEEQIEYVTAFVDPVSKFFEEVNDAAKNDTNEKLDEETSNRLWELGGFALQAPVEFGGLALNNTQYGRFGEIVGGKDLAVGIVVGAHQSIGFKGIMLYGTKEQKEKYLPQVATGKVYAAFCLTEPSAGSDASSIKSRAVKSPCGKYFILNGSKIWISNGGIADVMTVFAQTEMIDPKTGKKKDKVTAFIVERGFGGVSNGPPESKMGIKCSNTAEVFYEDVKIPIENVLGAEGEGFKVAMNILNNGRFGMAATLGGTMKACIHKATEFATNRVQFGNKIDTYGGIQEKLAKMSMLQYVTQSMAYMISGNMDLGSKDYHLEAAISKVFSSESAWYVCDEAIQIMGGMGYMKATGLEKMLRDLRIFRIFEGTNDILRLFVALTGIQYAGGHLKEIQKAFKNPAANLGLIFKEVSSRAIRSVGFGGTDMSQFVHPTLIESSKLCAESVDLFGRTVENLLLKHGKNIVNEQFLLNRLADAAIDIYGMTVTLSRSTRSLKLNLPSAEQERLLTQAWCIDASERVRFNVKKIENGQFLDLYSKMTQISKNVCSNGGVIQSNPYNIE